MTSKSWKQVEQSIGRYLGTDRTGALHEDQADLHSDYFSFEVKSRKNPFKVLAKYMTQAKKNAHGRRPVVIVHPDNGRHEKDIVCLELKDFRAIAQQAGLLDRVPKS